MRHGAKGKKFGRETKQRKALLKSLAVALIEQGKITTTQAKAKALKPYVEKLVTRGKNQTLANTRQLTTLLPGKTVRKLVKEVAVKYADRHGGYARIYTLNDRASDGAKMAVIEFVQ